MHCLTEPNEIIFKDVEFIQNICKTIGNFSYDVVLSLKTTEDTQTLCFSKSNFNTSA